MVRDDGVGIGPVESILKFPFGDPQWQNKFLVGSVLSAAGVVIPLLPLVFVYGYGVAVMRRAVRGEGLSLPEWDDWGALGRDGLWALLAGFVYLLPALLVFFVSMGLYMAFALGMPVLFALLDDPAAALGLGILAPFGAMGLLFLAMFVGMVLALLGMIPLPAAIAHGVASGEPAAAFRLREVWAWIKANKWGYFTAWVIVAGLGAVLYTVLMAGYYTLVLICLMPLLSAPLLFYVTVVGMGLFGTVYAAGTGG